jgi:YbbR domain-containing protein
VLLGGTTAPEQVNRLSVLLSRESLLRFALSFVLAIALWLYVTSKSNPNAAISLEQPIQILTANNAVGLTVTNQLPEANIRFRATNNNVQVNASNFRVFVDLLRMGPGVHRSVRVVCQSDPGIQCVSVTPKFVPVVIDRQQQKQVAVHPTVIGQPPQGYYASSFKTYPNTVSVSGPQTIASQVARASVDLNLAGATSTIDGTYRVSLLNSQGHPVTGAARLLVEPGQVTVHVDIKALSSFKPLPVLVSLKGQPRSGFGVTGVTVTPPEVTVEGSTTRLRRLKSISTQAVYLHNRSGGFSSRVRLLLPRGVTSVQKYATVRTRVQPVDASASIEVGVVLRGVTLGLSAHAVPARTLVTVVGPATSIRDVARSMHGVVELAGYGTGSFTVQPKITVPRGFKVANVYPSQIMVTLTPG